MLQCVTTQPCNASPHSPCSIIDFNVRFYGLVDTNCFDADHYVILSTVANLNCNC
eukprot:m.365148 g.365148  ORF g.365148 m.365148 type:complete len:55 (+) comp30171_c0_seq1:1254-1418(+)